MNPKTPFASIALEGSAAPRGLSKRHAAARPATGAEPLVVVVCHALAFVNFLCWVVAGGVTYGLIGLGLGCLLGLGSSLGLWGLGTAVQLLWRIERNTRS